MYGITNLKAIIIYKYFFFHTKKHVEHDSKYYKEDQQINENDSI